MNDAEIVIGARNDAQAVLDQLSQSLRSLGAPAVDASAKAQAAIGSLVSVATKAATSITGVFGAVAIGIGGGLIYGAVKDITSQAREIDKLNRQLDAYVGKNRIATEVHVDFAKSMRQSLNVSEEETLALIRKASQLGVTESRLHDAATGAIGLSKALGIDLDDALNKVIKGDERLVDVAATVNDGLREQGKELEGLSGLWQTLQANVKIVAEMVVTAMQPVTQAIADAAKWVGDTVRTSIVSVIAGLQTFQQASLQSIEFILAGFSLFLVQMTSEAQHAFTVTLPAYWSWFADNFVNIIDDAWTAVIAVQVRGTKALGQSVIDVVDFIKSGAQGGLLGVGQLTAKIMDNYSAIFEDFVPKTQALPEIADRQIGDLEASLTARMQGLGKDLGSKFSENFAENMKRFAIDVPQMTLPQLQFAQPDAAQSQAGRAARDLQAVESRLMVRGRADDKEERALKLNEQILRTLQNIDSKTKTPQPPITVNQVTI